MGEGLENGVRNMGGGGHVRVLHPDCTLPSKHSHYIISHIR